MDVWTNKYLNLKQIFGLDLDKILLPGAFQDPYLPWRKYLKLGREEPWISGTVEYVQQRPESPSRSVSSRRPRSTSLGRRNEQPIITQTTIKREPHHPAGQIYSMVVPDTSKAIKPTGMAAKQGPFLSMPLQGPFLSIPLSIQSSQTSITPMPAPKQPPILYNPTYPPALPIFKLPERTHIPVKPKGETPFETYRFQKQAKFDEDTSLKDAAFQRDFGLPVSEPIFKKPTAPYRMPKLPISSKPKNISEPILPTPPKSPDISKTIHSPLEDVPLHAGPIPKTVKNPFLPGWKPIQPIQLPSLPPQSPLLVPPERKLVFPLDPIKPIPPGYENPFIPKQPKPTPMRVEPPRKFTFPGERERPSSETSSSFKRRREFPIFYEDAPYEKITRQNPPKVPKPKKSAPVPKPPEIPKPDITIYRIPKPPPLPPIKRQRLGVYLKKQKPRTKHLFEHGLIKRPARPGRPSNLPFRTQQALKQSSEAHSAYLKATSIGSERLERVAQLKERKEREDEEKRQRAEERIAASERAGQGLKRSSYLSPKDEQFMRNTQRYFTRPIKESQKKKGRKRSYSIPPTGTRKKKK
jgi:hypothetical protein